MIADYSFKVALGEHNAHKPLLVLTQSSDPDTQVSYQRCMHVVGVVLSIVFVCAEECCEGFVSINGEFSDSSHFAQR